MTEPQDQQVTSEVETEAPVQEQQLAATQTGQESSAATEGPESAPGSAEEREQNTSEPSEETPAEDQIPEYLQKRMNQKHWEMMEAKREADKLRKELEEARKQTQPQLEIKDVPPLPDVWDDDYESKMKARDAIIANNVKAEARIEAEAESRKADIAKQEQEAYERQVKLQTDFNDRAKKVGINEQSLLEAQKLLVNNGLSGEKAYAVLTDDRGPQVAMYLAENPLELQTLLAMDTISAVRHIDRQISAKLAPPPTSTAPPPPDTLEGKGATQRDWFKEKHPNAVIE